MTKVFENYLSSIEGLSAEEINFSSQFFKPILVKKVIFSFVRESTALILDLSLMVL